MLALTSALTLNTNTQSCREVEGLAPTPSKAALEAPGVEPRLLDAAAKPAAALAAAGGAALASSGWGGGGGGATSGGSKAQKGQPRKPLGKLDNRGSGKASVLRAR